jgi:hypothetical protein
MPEEVPCAVPGCRNPAEDLEWAIPMCEAHDAVAGLSATIGTINHDLASWGEHICDGWLQRLEAKIRTDERDRHVCDLPCVCPDT